jgi:hypothetical protein
VKSYEIDIFVNQIHTKNIFKFLKGKKLSEDSKYDFHSKVLLSVNMCFNKMTTGNNFRNPFKRNEWLLI